MRHSLTYFPGHWLLPGLPVVLSLLISGCTSTAPVERGAKIVVAKTASKCLPSPAPAIADAFAAQPDSFRPLAEVELNQNSTLRIAASYNRKMQARREALMLQGIGFLSTHRDFGPLVRGTLAYLRSDKGNDSTDLSLGVSQLLPWGGNISLSTAAGRSTSHIGPGSNTASYTTSAGITLNQPLLANAGREAALEPLTQAERAMVYNLRSFALERQDFAISTLRSYYDMLLRQDLVDNTRVNLEQNTFLRQRSEALFKVGVVNSLDVMRAQQQEISAQNQLQSAETDVDVATSRFVMELGLPLATSVKFTGYIPVMKPFDLKESDCAALALSRRLDLQTIRDQLEDAERSLRIARRGMLPDLQATASAKIQGSSPDGFDDQSYKNGEDLSAGLTLTLPIDKRPDRYALKRAEIACVAARRTAAEKSDSVQLEIEESFRRMVEIKTSAEIAFQSMEIAQRRNEYALLRFKNGELSNRDVVEAQTELLNARNAHARALVQYETKRIQLLRDIGLIDVAADGTIVELEASMPPESPP